MKTQLFLVSIIAIVLFSFTAPIFGTTASFQGLGSGITATAVSADGTVLVGSSNGQAYRWSASDGIVYLGWLQPNYANYADAVSSNGSVVVGSSVIPNGIEAFRWTESQGMVGMGYLPGATKDSRACGVSADGSVIVGWGKAASGYYKAFYWTESLGMQDLLSESLTSYAEAVSADGLVVVGRSDDQAFLWTESAGTIGLGDLPGGAFWSGATDVSANGKIVAGYSSSASALGGNEAFCWTAETGMIGLGDLPGGDFYSVAEAVSSDGSVVVGGSVTSGNRSPVGVWTEEAFIWDPGNGMRNLKDVLENDHGLDLTGWILSEATEISDDGLTILGRGINPAGYEEGWIATIPEPATFLLFALAGLFLRKR